jgi:ech hydrogenase subunit E
MHTSEHQQTFVVPIGPQHPALKEPGHFEFTVDGEIITGASVRFGYAHRGMEKATESRNWTQNLYLLERVCGICSHIHATAYCLGVERLAGVTAPPRAQAIRQLIAEMERIHSHLLWLGVAAHEAGFETLFMYSWRDRETIMDLLEDLTGNRVNYSANILGGVKFDVNEAGISAVLEGIDFLAKRTEQYLEQVRTDTYLLKRTHRIGITSREQAERWGLTGPTARASGIECDLRIDAPYTSYSQFPVQIVTETAGDLQARFIVRMRELLESYNVIPAILAQFPVGDLAARMPRRIAEGETISRVEAPRGELFYFIKSNGTDKPERIKIRTPSLCNFASVMKLAVGQQLADIPMILVGIDPCFSCNDRMVVINHPDRDHEHWTWEQLRQYGIEFYARRSR